MCNQHQWCDKAVLASRLKLIRCEKYGEAGSADLAAAIGIPAATWANYEEGVTVPAEVLLRFMVLTQINPGWLLHGIGRKYKEPLGSSSRLLPWN